MKIGSRMGCHQRADRSFFIGNYQFPLCARCTGIVISSIIGYFIFFLKSPKIRMGLFLIIPMAIDGTIQLAKIKESTNRRRFITGLLGGIGLVIIRMNIYKKNFDKTRNKRTS